MDKDFKLDFENKKIEYVKDASGEIYSVQDLYSFLQDIFDEPEFMRYDLPIEAVSKSKFKLINDWSIDNEAKKHLKGNLI